MSKSLSQLKQKVLSYLKSLLISISSVSLYWKPSSKYLNQKWRKTVFVKELQMAAEVDHVNYCRMCGFVELLKLWPSVEVSCWICYYESVEF